MIELTVSSPTNDLRAYQYFWLKYVRGFNPAVHCARCLLGSYEKSVGTKMLLSARLRISHPMPFRFLYLCGVTRKWENNLHIAMQPREGSVIDIEAYGGIRVLITGAEQLPIPEIKDGFRDLSREFTTCRNWRFGVRYFGLKSEA